MVYLVNGEPDEYARGFSMALNGTLLDEFDPSDEKMHSPHDIAISKDEKCLFVAQLRPPRLFKVQFYKVNELLFS